jgi:hypothetical protein
MVLFNGRFNQLGTRSRWTSLPLRRRSRPMPRYFHKALLLRKRQGVPSQTNNVTARTQEDSEQETLWNNRNHPDT